MAGWKACPTLDAAFANREPFRRKGSRLSDGRREGRFRSRARRWMQVVSVGIILALPLLFWQDVCLWRAEACLVQRDHLAAANWAERSQWLHWFRQEASARLCLLRIRMARRRGDFAEVESQLKRGAQLQVPFRELERQRLLALAQTGQFSLVQSRWNELLLDPRDDGPEIARAYYTWSMLNHHLDEAEQTLLLWHKDYPRDPEPWTLLGRYYQSLENWQRAEDAYRQALELDPENDEYRLSLANALLVRLKSDEALRLFEEYRRGHPNDPAAARGAAKCAANLGDLSTAVRVLRAAYERNPDDFQTQMDYGELLLSLGKAAEAVPVLEAAHRAVPEHANLAYALARGLKATGRGAEAEPLFAFVAQSRPKLDEMAELEKKLRRQPHDLELRMRIASIVATYVSRRDALRWYENLLQIAPHYEPARAALTELRRQLGEPLGSDQPRRGPRRMAHAAAAGIDDQATEDAAPSSTRADIAP